MLFCLTAHITLLVDLLSVQTFVRQPLMQPIIYCKRTPVIAVFDCGWRGSDFLDESVMLLGKSWELFILKWNNLTFSKVVAQPCFLPGCVAWAWHRWLLALKKALIVIKPNVIISCSFVYESLGSLSPWHFRHLSGRMCRKAQELGDETGAADNQGGAVGK